MPHRDVPSRGGSRGGLSSNQLDQLDRRLATRPSGLGSLEALDGYLAAVIGGPASHTFSDVLPRVLGNAGLDDVAGAEPLLDLASGHWHAVAADLASGDYRPALASRADGCDGEAWARAFLEGVAFGGQGWDRFFSLPRGADLRVKLTAFAGGLPGARPDLDRQLSVDDRAALMDTFAVIALAASDFFAAQPDRAGPSAPEG